MRLVVGLASAAAVLLAGCGAPGTQNQNAGPVTPVKPAKPIAVTVLDGAGSLVGAKPALEEFVHAHPELVSSISYQSAAAPDVAGKIKAQQTANAVDITLVLGGPDVLGAAQQQGLVIKQEPDLSAQLPDLSTIQDKPMQGFQALAEGYGVMSRYNPSGPLLASTPQTPGTVPTTPEELLSWAKAHPGKFGYAQPPNSGPGRTLMMSLPYILKDKDPSDPVNGWEKTWAYLAELGKYISSYPASSTIMNQQFGAGQLQLVPTIVSMDINNRSDGTWPADEKVSLFTDQHWVADGHFMMIPKGVSGESLYVALEMEKAIVSEKGQAATYSSGALTTANKNVTTAMADAKSKQLIAKYGRPDFYPTAFKTGVVHQPLSPANLQKAFDLWQRNVGSKVGG